MNTSVWSSFIAPGTVKAICWTLIHSLWIGLVIALLCGIVIATTRKSSAALRYRLLCGLLVLFSFSIGVTYSVEARLNTTPSLPAAPLVTVVIGNNASVSQQLGTVLNKSIVDRAVDFLNQNTTVIFLAWLLFFLFKSLKMAGGRLHVERIRNYKTQAVSEDLKQRVGRFSREIGIRRAVGIAQSGLVKVPVAVGWLKPMILLPVGVLFQFSPEQIDSILWHELGHIRRGDYLVNILQGIVETAFFFNPGLLWLSSLIRAEREACCDDIVLSRMNKKANYLEALLAFGYGEFKTTNWAMGVGSGSQLGDRLKRIINRENKRLGVIEKVFLIAGIVVLSGFAGLRTVNKKYITQVSYESQVNASAEQALTGTAPIKAGVPAYGKIDSLINLTSTSSKRGDYPGIIVTDITAEDIHGKTYHLTLAGNKLVGLELNGRKIKESALPAYQYMADEFRNKGKAEGVVMAKRLKAWEPGFATSSTRPDTAIRFYNLHFEGNPADKANYTAFVEDAAHNKYKITVTNGKPTALNINGNTIEQRDLPKYAYLLKHIPPPPPPPPAPPGPLSPKSPSSDSNKNDIKNTGEQPDKPQQPQQPQKPAPPPSLDKMISDVTNDLINQRIIKDKSDLSTIKLTYAELVVNGVKQPDDIQKKFCAKYYPGNSRVSNDPNYGLWYNARTHGVALGSFNLDLDAL